ncbi:16S rRNA (guanine(966)-N(2))-methyltransferase RsmD [Clostridium sp. MSJ-11]|uniref:16S rRNA (Guanine(966)-N(2))-methyltransferase RsmD n=1 Tax=Clostridium mobile TaxID=2841512 RepID=A0ABS6EE15_9CLOT|nr:16S rRNA (guanine(966)-N(2))-methyltransferase RsmD [Clostridium mobile]MBU5482740.1 16S rRNA (guanine(966)-N(2))-methyltransferase RsmD [Clostridium mobile]
MRIISGLAKGRKLLSPEGMGTRPTLDRVKENIFNIIQNDVYDTVAVDLFSGTGSLGLEAVSRGAKKCYLIDKGDVTFKYLKENVKNLNFEDKCECLNMSAYDALKLFYEKGIIFDLIFIDPPYLKNMIPPAIEDIDKNNLLNKDGLIVTKIDSSEEIFLGTDNVKLTGHRKYGNTTICFYRHKED